MKFSEFSQFDVRETTYEFELVHPTTRQGLGVFLTIISPESEKPRACTNEMLRRQQQMERMGKTPTLESIEKSFINLCAAMLVDWRGVEDEEGKAIEFSEANARKYLLNISAFREQISEAGKDAENFIKA